MAKKTVPAIYYAPAASRFLVNRTGLRSRDAVSLAVRAWTLTRQLADAAGCLLAGREEEEEERQP